jgi:lipid-A-disaccharide synthase
MDEEVVKELIQHEFNYKNLKRELYKITQNKAERNRILADYKILKEKLGDGGASRRTAIAIFNKLAHNQSI